MPVHSAQLRVSTEGNGDIIDITRGVQEVVQTSGVDDGIVNVFVAHSTAAIGLIEYEAGGVRDLKDADGPARPAGRRLPAQRGAGRHQRPRPPAGGDHRPIRDGARSRTAGSQTGTWQQFVLLDFDDTPRERTVMVQVLG